jgi:ParB-like nuclease domain
LAFPKAAGTAIEGQDRQSEIRSLQAKVSLLPLPKIIDRVTDTRELKAQHVEDLMVSISVLGLLEPLVVDSRNRLLAGGHRKMAIHRLKEQMFTEYSQLLRPLDSQNTTSNMDESTSLRDRKIEVRNVGLEYLR